MSHAQTPSRFQPFANSNPASSKPAPGSVNSGSLNPADVEIKPREVFVRDGLIDSILDLNPTASREFLQRFTSDQLEAYLEHLSIAKTPRGTTPWVRRGTHPAVSAFRPSA